MDADNVQGMMGQAQLAAGTPSVEKTLSAPGMGFANEKASSVFGQPKPAQASPLETQYQQMLATARKAANDVKKRYTAGVQPVAPQQNADTNAFHTAQMQVGGNNAGQGVGFASLDAAFGLQSPTPQAQPSIESPLPQFVPMKGMFGGGDTMAYEYNGAVVSLPQGVDMNDANAVRSAMKTRQNLIDTLTNNNEEEF